MRLSAFSPALFGGTTLQQTLSVSESWAGLAPAVPSLNLTLTPLFDAGTGHVTAISAAMSVQSPELGDGAILATLALAIGNVPTSCYDGDALQARDDHGPLPLVQRDDESTRERAWYLARETAGDVVLTFIAYPRNVTAETPPGPRVDLIRDQGGLNGGGVTFIPTYARPDDVFDLRVEWNLTGAPAGTSGVWSFGEAPVATRRAPAGELSDSFYAVGPLNHYTSDYTPGYGMYWMGTPHLFDITAVAMGVEELFNRMSSFFEDPGASYRVFFRRTARGWGGTSTSWSFMIEWSDAMIDFPNPLESLLFLISHEMVHNWPTLEQSKDDSEEGEAWYTEGIANFYQAWLPYRFQLIPALNFMKDANAVMGAYYLSPAVHMSLDHAAEVAWQNVAALKINYDRGAVYHARMNRLLARASNGTRSLDNIARTLIRARRERGAAWGRREYLALLSHELGEEVAHQEFETMFNGEQLVVPPSDAFGPCFTLRRVDKYPVDLGFPFGNPGSGTVIRNLDPGSRAALAGLREGDQIVHNTRGFWSLSDDYEMLMHMEVKRADGQENAEIVYWPHGWTKVEAYEWVLQTEMPDCAT